MNNLIKVINNPSDPLANFHLAFEYEDMGHLASAVTHYLKAADYSKSVNLQYEAMLRVFICYDKAKGRADTCRNILLRTVALQPKRPEAYFLLSQFHEYRQEWHDSYMYASIGLTNADNSENTMVSIGYLGKYVLEFQKGVAAWWVGLTEESRQIMYKLNKAGNMAPKYTTCVLNNIKNTGNPKSTFEWGVDNDPIFIEIVAQEIFVDRVYENHCKVKEGDVVVDIGASAGPFAYSIMEKSPKRVVCVEPSTNFFEVLKRNMEPYPNVTLINKAIVSDDYDGEKVNIFWENETNSFDTTTFKEFIKDNNLDKINFMKMDCEGGEYDIFTAENIEYLTNNVDYIIAELHFANSAVPNHYKFRHFLNTFLSKISNFRVFTADGKIEITKNIFDLTIMTSGYYNEILISIDNRKK